MPEAARWKVQAYRFAGSSRILGCWPAACHVSFHTKTSSAPTHSRISYEEKTSGLCKVEVILVEHNDPPCGTNEKSENDLGDPSDRDGSGLCHAVDDGKDDGHSNDSISLIN